MRVKYPRTHHLPFSPVVSSDDRVLKDLSQFADQEVVVTVKMDGELRTVFLNGTLTAVDTLAAIRARLVQ